MTAELGAAASDLVGHLEAVNPLSLLQGLGPTGILIFLIAREARLAYSRRRNGGVSALHPRDCPLEPNLSRHLEQHAAALERQHECLKAIKDNTQATRDGINRLAGQGGM